jgi:hypothetical protein
MNVPSSWCNSWKAGDNHKLEEKVASEVNGIEEFMDMISSTRIDGLPSWRRTHCWSLPAPWRLGRFEKVLLCLCLVRVDEMTSVE